jgi:exopolysaccharide biosynthesis predicted pyruvyltransferase EpsI
MDSLSPLYACGPSEFLYLIKNAFLVCTDSFHGVVFSIIYDTPFIVFSREDKKEKDMSSRIDTLLDKFNLQYRKFNGKIDKEIFKCNYEEISKILNEERQNAQNL